MGRSDGSPKIDQIVQKKIPRQANKWRTQITEILRQVKLVGENDGNRGHKTGQMVKSNESPKTGQELVNKI